MGSTLNLLYDYVQDLEYLIRKADELAKKSVFKEELSKLREIESFRSVDLTIRQIEYLTSLSRILVNYGFSQTYKSFNNACSLLLADYDYTKEVVDMAVEKLKKSASQLYVDEDETGFLWGAYDVSDPWALLVEMLTESDNEAMARRNYYLKRIAELASLEGLADAMFYGKSDEIALSLSPLRLEMQFARDERILPEVLSLHANETDLC